MRQATMPLSFVLVGDLHATVRDTSRVGHVIEAKRMADQVADFANKVNAYGVGSTGDIMHSKSHSTHACTRFAVGLVNRMRSNGDEQLVREFYTTPGNHDISPGVMSTIGKSPLGVLVEADVVKNVAARTEYIETPKGEVIVFGIEHFGKGLGVAGLIRSKVQTAMRKSSSAVPTKGILVLIHEEVSPTELIDAVALSGEFPPLVIVNGHIHDKQDVSKKGSMTCVRLGVFSRLSRAEADIVPMMAHVVFYANKEPSVKLIPLSVETGPEIFRSVAPKVEMNDTSAFIEALRNVVESDSEASWEDAVKAAACKAKVNDGIVSRAIGYLARAEDR